jgi:PAS domain S-box-containing protein
MKKVLLKPQEDTINDTTRSFDIENIPDPIVAVDTHAKIVVWNKAAEKLYGWKKDEVLGKKEVTLLKSRLLNSTIENYHHTVQRKGMWQGEVIQYKKDGTRLFVLSSIQQLKRPDGAVIGTIGFNKDITKHKHIEYNLRFLSGAFRAFSTSLDYKVTLQKVAQLAVPRIADWCVIDFLNDRGQLEEVAITHKDPKKVKLAHEYRRHYPPHLESATGIAQVLRTGKPEMYPFIPDEMLMTISKDARHLNLMRKIGFTSIIIVPIISQNRSIGTISLVSAESRRQYTELDLQTAEKLASRASVAIENAILYQNAAKEIEERLREMETRKDNFISMASHELKTPVTSLKIYRDLLERQLAEKNIKEYNKVLAVMDNQIHKLTMLITDLLNLSKIQVGKLDFRMTTLNLVDVVQSTIDDLQPSTDHNLVIQVQKQRIIVYGDKDRLGQVLINLITNAIKYSPDGKKVIITVSTTATQARVSVRDFGVGISKDHREKIFERFYQIEAKDKTYPGLGMGLYISQEIIQRHSGKLWVDKAKGKGSIFTFTLPISKKNK